MPQRIASGENLSLPTVQLLHALPGGSLHVDWMIALDSRSEAPLVSFRVERAVSELEIGQSLEAEQIGDHRPVYLTYEGPVSGHRGHVRRLSTGTIVEAQVLDDRTCTLGVQWPTGRQRLRLENDGTANWRVISLAFDAVSRYQ